MANLDERQIISIFQRAFIDKRLALEDVETFRIGKKLVVIKTDTLVFSTDVPQGMRLADAARKSMVACVSDFAAKGVLPTYCIISVSIPRSFSRSDIMQIASGFRSASKEFSVKILGGDTNESKEPVITVSMFGIAHQIKPRSGAEEGDVIIVTGPFGRTRAGLEILLYGRKAKKRFRSLAKNAVFRAEPRLRFGTLASRYITSAMDSSDGLSTTLIEMARQSRKRFTITNIPMDADLEEFAKSNNLDLMRLVFNGGEEYEIVATAPIRNICKLERVARKCGIDLQVIGRVENGVGVILERGKVAVRDGGWSHFA